MTRSGIWVLTLIIWKAPCILGSKPLPCFEAVLSNEVYSQLNAFIIVSKSSGLNTQGGDLSHWTWGLLLSKLA